LPPKKEEMTMEETKNQPSIEERIDVVLDKLRPFLEREGGNIKLARFDKDTGVCYVDMIGACAACMLAASDVSDSVEVMLMDEIPEITKVELVAPTMDNEFDNLLKTRQAQQAQEAQQDAAKNAPADPATKSDTENK
jgi:Fe-S cluster biogenesis protein NfuA